MTMPDDETTIRTLENEFPARSSEAFAAARRRVLASGQSVLQAEGGVIFEVFPDGHKIERKRIEPPTRVVPGVKIEIP